MSYRNMRTLSVLAARLLNSLDSLVDVAASMFGHGAITRIRHAHPRQHEPQGCAQFAKSFRETFRRPTPVWPTTLLGRKPRTMVGLTIGRVPVALVVETAVGRRGAYARHAQIGCRATGTA